MSPIGVVYQPCTATHDLLNWVLLLVYMIRRLRSVSVFHRLSRQQTITYNAKNLHASNHFSS